MTEPSEQKKYDKGEMSEEEESTCLMDMVQRMYRKIKEQSV